MRGSLFEATDPNLQTSATRYAANGNLLNFTQVMSAADNLVANSSFELDVNADNWPDNWTQLIEPSKTASFAWSTTTKFGPKSVSISNPTGWAIVGSDKFSYTAGDKYIVSGYAKTTNTTNTAVVKLEFFDSANTWLGQQTAYQLQGTHDWTRVQAVVDSVPANTTQLKVSVGLNAGTGTAYFDGIQLEKGTTLSAYNLVENASLERDTITSDFPDNWEKSGNLSANDKMDENVNPDDEKVYIGKYSFKLTGETSKNKYIKQHINVSGYDKNGNTTKTLFPKGDTVSNTYNALNRMDGVYYNSVKQWGLAYDANGNLTTITDGAGNTTSSMSYDKNNRLTQQAEGASNSIAYGYDENSNLTSLTATAGTTTVATGYTFNPMNLMVAVSRNGANQAKFVYDERGNVTSVTYSNGTYAAYEYDAANHLKSVKNYNPAGALLDSYTYSYDANSNITSIVTGAGTISYQYDALNQLTQETLLDGTVIDYEYDSVGNRTKKTVTQGSVTTTNYTYDVGNQLTAVNGQAQSRRESPYFVRSR